MYAERVEQGVVGCFPALHRLLVSGQCVFESTGGFQPFAKAVVGIGAVRIVADVGLQVGQGFVELARAERGIPKRVDGRLRRRDGPAETVREPGVVRLDRLPAALERAVARARQPSKTFSNAL